MSDSGAGDPTPAGSSNTGMLVSAPAPGAEKVSKWTWRDDITLLDTLVQQRNLGHSHDAVWTPDAWEAVAQTLEGSELVSGGAKKTIRQCKARWQRLKIEYRQVKYLREQPGFSWNEETMSVTATSADWDAYLADHKDALPWRKKGFVGYNRVQFLLENQINKDEFTRRWRAQPQEPTQAAPTSSTTSLAPSTSGVFSIAPQLYNTGSTQSALPGTSVIMMQQSVSSHSSGKHGQSDSEAQQKRPYKRPKEDSTSAPEASPMASSITLSAPPEFPPPSPYTSTMQYPPSRMSAAIQVVEQTEGLPDEDFVAAVRMFQRRQESADAYLAIQSGRARSLYLRAELEDFAKLRPIT